MQRVIIHWAKYIGLRGVKETDILIARQCFPRAGAKLGDSCHFPAPRQCVDHCSPVEEGLALSKRKLINSIGREKVGDVLGAVTAVKMQVYVRVELILPRHAKAFGKRVVSHQRKT